MRPQRLVCSDHSLEGLRKDFEPYPKKQEAVERFLAELYHHLILSLIWLFKSA